MPFYLSLILSVISTLLFIPSPTSHAAIQTTGLVGEWLNSSINSSSTTWADSANSNTLAITGATYNSANHGSESLNGTSSNYIMDNSNISQFSSTSTQSFFMWIKPAVLGGNIEEMGRAPGSSGAQYEQVLSLNSSGNLYYWDYSTVYGCPGETSSGTISANQWSYVGFVKSTSGSTVSFTFYINGVASGTFSNCAVAAINSNNFIMGMDWRDTSSFYSGLIGSAAMWNTALTAADVTNAMNATNWYTTAPAISSTNTTQNLLINTPISSIVTTNTGGAVNSYSISPSLPAGLTLDAAAGGISGTPTVSAAAQTYVLTATNNMGTSTVSITLTVNPWLVNISPPATAAFNQTSSFNATVWGGGTVTFFANSKKIFRCVALIPVSNSITCNWKPNVHGNFFMYAVLSGGAQTITSSQVKVMVVSRTTARQP